MLTQNVSVDTHALLESQTQDETQFPPISAFSKVPDSKRKVASQDQSAVASAPKKMKISMVDGVDIEE